jgi:hypothetical protein
VSVILNIFVAYKAAREEFIRNINRLALLVIFIGAVYLLIVTVFGKSILGYLYGDQLVAGYSIYLLISIGAVFDLISISYRLSLEIIATRLAAKVSMRVSLASIAVLILSSVFGTYFVCFVYVFTRIVYALTLYIFFKVNMAKQIYNIYMS